MIGPHLGGDQYLLAPDAGSAQAVAHFTLILVSLGSVDVAIAEPDRLLDDARAGAAAQLPGAEPDRGDFGAVGFDKMHVRSLTDRGCIMSRRRRTANVDRLKADHRQDLASAAKTVSGACAITASKARAGPRGARLPCSQFRMVSTGTPSRSANSCWVSWARRRRSRTSGVPGSGAASGVSGNSCPSRSSTIRPSAFSRKRC